MGTDDEGIPNVIGSHSNRSHDSDSDPHTDRRILSSILLKRFNDQFQNAIRSSFDGALFFAQTVISSKSLSQVRRTCSPEFYFLSTFCVNLLRCVIRPSMC